MIEPLPKELQDFRAFLWLCWQHLNLPEPTEVQYDVANYLQQGKRRKVIQGFRGVGKSWVTSAYVVWRLRMNPQLNFLVASASKERADNFSTFTLRLINDMPILQCLRPSSSQRESKIAFDVATAEADHAPSVKSVGITGQLSGSRADEIIADDVEVQNNSMTQPLREKLAEAIKEFDAIIKPHGIITYLGTPQTEQTIYNLLPARGYEIRIYPARYPDRKQVLYYGERLAPIISRKLYKEPELVGHTTDPKRFSDIDLLEREASWGRSGFALQFMLDTSLSDRDRHPLKLRDLIVMSVDSDTAPEKVIWTNDQDKEIDAKTLPCVGLAGDKYYQPLLYKGDWLPYEASVMAIDPSGRGKDETSYAIGKVLNSQIFVTDAGGIKGGYDEETLLKLVLLAKQHKVNIVVIESNFGDGMFQALISPYFTKHYPVTIEEVRHNTQKERRIIDTLEPVMNQHKLIFDRSVIEKDYTGKVEGTAEETLQYQLMYQMSHITSNRGCLGHDDRVDVLAMMVAQFTKMMDLDADTRIKLRQEMELQHELDIFMGRATGKLTGLTMRAVDGKMLLSSNSNFKEKWC